MKKILGAAIGTCVHVGGLYHFLKIAEAEGYYSILLGPAVSISRIVDAIIREKPEITAISYRLTPEVAGTLFEELEKALKSKNLSKSRLIFGGTPPVSAIARNCSLFERSFDGSESMAEIQSYLRGTWSDSEKTRYASDLISRIRENYPYPILRHHFGRPTMEETLKGIREIALSGVLDVISIGPDQNAQEHFFRPGGMDHNQTGAGGVPVRSSEDMASLYEASRCGNHPLMRCYAGTRDLLKWAEMSVTTMNNAWGAIPLCWYNVMDGRSNRTLKEAISENQSVMKWYASKNLPVEVNESHQWSLRDAHDSLAVAMAYLAAYNAKKMGVMNYIAQFMFNTPPGTNPLMDLAKMAAKLEMISELEDDSFKIFREVRAGIAHFSPVPFIAKGQLAASAMISLSMKPHILHVVGYSEGDHATFPGELIESCQIVHGVVRNSLNGLPDVWADENILSRKAELVYEAKVLIESLGYLGADCDDPKAEPYVIASAIKEGFLDTPHFKGNPHLCGNIITGLVNGAWYAINPSTGEPIDEEFRLRGIINRLNKQ
ncbi:MAG TPA: cobalamin B12-binding domain-containing protein [Bacteroidales bacterium]|nr:cobalamin B12-binding domain-containing protein [Bacteroidales bacterium]